RPGVPREDPVDRSLAGPREGLPRVPRQGAERGAAAGAPRAEVTARPDPERWEGPQAQALSSARLVRRLRHRLQLRLERQSVADVLDADARVACDPRPALRPGLVFRNVPGAGPRAAGEVV